MKNPVIVDVIRTPFGKKNGAFRETRPDDLLASVLNNLMKKTGLPHEAVEDIIVGCVTQVGEQGANIARLGTLLSDFPATTPATTINRLCGSSQQALHFGAQAIAAGDMKMVIAAGTESMTRIPMFSDVGDLSTINKKLFKKYKVLHQIQSAELIAKTYGISRELQDEFSLRSHDKAVQFAETLALGTSTYGVTPHTGLDRDGNPFELLFDEGVRSGKDLSFSERLAKMGMLPGVTGTENITAGNASQISDGASAVLLADRDMIQGYSQPMFEIVARVVVGDDPTLQLMGVIPATKLALKKAGITISNLNWIEINEAFASVVLAWAKELQPPAEIVNPWGGAIAHGHPLGATGTALMAKMVEGLRACGPSGEWGLQVMCIGHGQATATVIRRIN